MMKNNNKLEDKRFKQAESLAVICMEEWEKERETEG
jgi:hypothetical protein